MDQCDPQRSLWEAAVHLMEKFVCICGTESAVLFVPQNWWEDLHCCDCHEIHLQLVVSPLLKLEEDANEDFSLMYSHSCLFSPGAKSKKCLSWPMFSSRSLVVSGLTFKSLFMV